MDAAVATVPQVESLFDPVTCTFTGPAPNRSGETCTRAGERGMYSPATEAVNNSAIAAIFHHQCRISSIAPKVREQRPGQRDGDDVEEYQAEQIAAYHAPCHPVQ